MKQLSIPVKHTFKYITNASLVLEIMAENMNKSSTNHYYEMREAFQKQLREFLRTDFSNLNGKQMLKLCALVSTYRPVEPFSFLITCSNLIK